MYREYYYCVDYYNPNGPELISRLEQSHTKYETYGVGVIFSDGIPAPACINFTLKSYTELNQYIESAFRVKARERIVYTHKEIESAQFLLISPKRWSVDPAKDLEEFVPQDYCLDHLGRQVIHTKKQTRPIAVSRVPSMKGNCPFWYTTLGIDALFTSQRVKDLAEAKHLKGIQFTSATYCDGTPRKEGLYQMLSEDTIHLDDIITGKLPDAPEPVVCPYCGFTQLAATESLQLHLRQRSNGYPDDFYATDPLFGYYLAMPFHIISQNFYQVLKAERLVSSVWFEPVLIDE